MRPIVPPRLLTVSIGVIAFIGACVAHELVGHGGGCLLEGGRISLVSTVYFRCRGGGLAADLGGPFANTVVGLTCFGLLRWRRWGAPTTTLLRLGVAFDMLWLAGCMVWSALAGQSDFAYLLRLLAGGETIGRIVVGTVGIGVALVTLRFLAEERVPRAVLRTAYVAAGVLCCTSTLFFTGRTFPALREAALESFASLGWLLVVPAKTGSQTYTTSTAVDLGWVIVATTIAIAFCLTLGAGFDYRGAVDGS